MPAPTNDLAPLAAATEGLPTPYAVVDLDAFDANSADMVERAHGLPIRIASKSLRCRTLMDRALASPPPVPSAAATLLVATEQLGPGFQGIMAYSLREAIWLARQGETDILLGYPSVDVGGLAQLDDPELAAPDRVDGGQSPTTSI